MRLRHVILFLLMAVSVTPIRAGISTDYLLGGALTLKNGRIDKCYFEGGFARAFETSATTDRFVFYYYNQDHLGNNREVVDIKGRIHQVTNYYPFGAPYADENAIKGKSLQPYKYNGKELDLMHGLNTYDYGARQYDPILARWDRVDPLAEKYYPFTPYSYCAGDPVNKFDPDGKKVFLYATTLPTDNKLIKLGGIPTHTFITVENSEGKVMRYAAYGPENGNPLMGFNQLKECHYEQDVNVYKGNDTENLKAKIEVPVPEGMSSKAFDKAVINTINSFGNEKGIRYDILPTNDIQGNCNSSSSTILLKSGVSKETVNQIGEQIPGIKTGFDSEAKPWTSEEQKEAIKDYHEDMCKKSTL